MPLIVYVIGVAIAWSVVLGLAWFIGGSHNSVPSLWFVLDSRSECSPCTLPCTSIRHSNSGISPKGDAKPTSSMYNLHLLTFHLLPSDL